MKGIAWLALGSGIVLIALVLVLPYVLEWQWNATLARYGAEHMASSFAADDVRKVVWGMGISWAIGCVCIIAGLLILRRRKLGLHVWLSVCGLIVVLSVIEFLLRGPIVGAMVRGLWWLMVLIVSLRLAWRNPIAESWWIDGTTRKA